MLSTVDEVNYSFLLVLSNRLISEMEIIIFCLPVPKSYFEGQMGLSRKLFFLLKNSTNIIKILNIEIA